jgi:hypothetical protein
MRQALKYWVLLDLVSVEYISYCAEVFQVQQSEMSPLQETFIWLIFNTGEMVCLFGLVFNLEELIPLVLRSDTDTRNFAIFLIKAPPHSPLFPIL